MGTSGSEGGQQKPTSRKAGRALLSDPYTYVASWVGFVYVAFHTWCPAKRSPAGGGPTNGPPLGWGGARWGGGGGEGAGQEL